jgi:trehalose-6-phosphate synthase
MTVQDLQSYLIFYESVLKPLFHNFKSLYEDLNAIESPEYWKEFMSVNQKFASKIIEVKN